MIHISISKSKKILVKKSNQESYDNKTKTADITMQDNERNRVSKRNESDCAEEDDDG